MLALSVGLLHFEEEIHFVQLLIAQLEELLIRLNDDAVKSVENASQPSQHRTVRVPPP